MRVQTRILYLYWTIYSSILSLASAALYPGGVFPIVQRCLTLNTDQILSAVVDDLLGSSLRTALHDILALDFDTAICLCSEEYLYDSFIDSHLSNVATLVGREHVKRKLDALITKRGNLAFQCSAGLPRREIATQECNASSKNQCFKDRSRPRQPRAEHKGEKSRKPTVHDAVVETTKLTTQLDKLYTAIPYRWRACDSDRANPFENLLDEIVDAIRAILAKSDTTNQPEKHAGLIKQLEHVTVEINHALNWPSVDEDTIKTLRDMRSKNHEALDSLHELHDILGRCTCSHSPELSHALDLKTGDLIQTAKDDKCIDKPKPSSSSKMKSHKRSKGLKSSAQDVIRELAPLQRLVRALEQDDIGLRKASKSSKGVEAHAVYLVSRRTRLFLDTSRSLGSSHKLDLEPAWRLLQALDVEILSCIRTAGLSDDAGKRLDDVLHDVQQLMASFSSITSMLDSCDCQTDDTLISGARKHLGKKDHDAKQGEDGDRKEKSVKAEKGKREQDDLGLHRLLSSLTGGSTDDQSAQRVITGVSACRRVVWSLDQTAKRLHDACDCNPEDEDRMGLAIDGLLDHISHVSKHIHDATQKTDERMYQDLLNEIEVLLGNMFDVSERVDLSCEMVGIVDDLIDAGKALLAIIGNLLSTLRQCGCGHDPRVTEGLRSVRE